ncbi:YtxH domain-containing protein [Citricoccus sp.]|uniref:YtxH domain-containing protein n=1 Tax=Citricoccus sp. TaxID=1978372 RepID=UPI00260ECC60|nr:YtxH domain-containing protein [Citricoccus sp.]HRO28931.1 YtxH domain-containing protein [Citricoccus sp.]HRO95009.1 YtxH domain-containing protein [Citricoccus sp.]
MKRLITLGVGAAIGYLLGSREGRQNLDKFAKNAQKLWNDPKTQEQVHKAASTVKDKAPGVADKATGLADKAADSIRDRAPGVADKASAAAHAVADKATAATQGLADRAGTTSQDSGGKHASAGTSYDTAVKESEGTSGTGQQGGTPTPGPSQTSGGSGPDRY